MNKELEKLINQINQNKNYNINIDDPITGEKILFSVTNKKTITRALNLFKKEPITIEWIRSFEKNSVFFDIGANIGQFTIFAAIVSKSRIFAFEPESNNFQGLMQNIYLNKLFNKVTAYPIGISDVTALTKLYLNSFSKADSHHSVNYKTDSDLKKKEFELFQGIFSSSLDDLLEKWKLPLPNYIKIDVDGIENKIIKRAGKILANKKLKSMIVEFKSERKEDLLTIKKLQDHGFTYDKKQVKNVKKAKKTGF